MRFQYDPAKAAANVSKHGVWFADAEGVFKDPLALLMENHGLSYHLGVWSLDTIRVSP